MSITELQDLLNQNEVFSVNDLGESGRARLALLAGRLRKVRSWGGDYAEITLSPRMEAMLAELEVGAPRSRMKVLAS